MVQNTCHTICTWSLKCSCNFDELLVISCQFCSNDDISDSVLAWSCLCMWRNLEEKGETNFICSPRIITWWSQAMESVLASLAFCEGNPPIAGEFPAQRTVTRSFYVFFDLRLNKRLSKQSWGWRFERHRAHYDVIVMWKLWVWQVSNQLKYYNPTKVLET